MSGFLQRPPVLPNAWDGDDALRSVVRAHLDGDAYERARDHLGHVGDVVTRDETLALARRAESEPPELIPYGTWGERVDEIQVSPAYTALGRMGVELGVTALPYEDAGYGDAARVVWGAVLAMWGPSSALYSCPVAMTDAAARTLLVNGGPEDLDAVERLTTRDPDRAWTSGQWMTETTGGSDVGRTETTARRDGNVWRLYGTKWFTSAMTSEMALTLARPEGAPEGSRGLGLFKILRNLEDGSRNAIRIRRLKDKLGTRAMPTAELELEGAVATPVGDPTDGGGLRRIATMLNLTRLHNAFGAVGSMGRGLAWARSFADVREVFGRPLRDQPLHQTTLAELAVDHLAALALSFRCTQLTGRVEHGTATETEVAVLRGLTPIAKLATARWAVASAAEAMEALGGVGYCEDSGLPALVRNAHVLPIWEGTTNVLSLDVLRAQQRAGALDALLTEVQEVAARASAQGLQEVGREMLAATSEVERRAADGAGIEAGARALALTVASTYACSRLTEMGLGGSEQGVDAARRLAERGLVAPPPPRPILADR